MPPDPESVSLPEQPPPRPVARDAAIAAAMRRFDGEEGPAVPAKSRSTPWTRRPQFQLAMAASLVLVVGLPAAVIGLRQQWQNPGTAPAPATGTSTRFEPDQAARAPAAQAPASEESQSAVAPPPAAPPQVAAPKEVAAPVESANPAVPSSPPAAERASADALAPPPPPPPPPPAPALAQKSAEGTSSGIVVTGSRIARPSLESPSPITVVDNRASERDEIAAKDFTQKDRSYASFLQQLQAAVRDNDPGAVVRLIGFPLRVNSGGQSQTYSDAKSVRRDYDNVFTPRVRRAILAQQADRLFSRDLGVMIGNGEVWFDHTCLDNSCSRLGPVRITAINR